MSESIEKQKPKALERVGGYMGIIGAIAIGIVTADAYLDFIDLPGDNPFEGEDGTNFKKVLRELRDVPGAEVAAEDFTVQQTISTLGMAGTLFSMMFGRSIFKNMSVGGSLTLGTLAAYEAMLLLPLGFSTGGLFFAGAASSMYGVGLMQAVQEPKSPLDKARDGMDKVKKITRRK